MVQLRIVKYLLLSFITDHIEGRRYALCFMLNQVPQFNQKLHLDKNSISASEYRAELTVWQLVLSTAAQLGSGFRLISILQGLPFNNE